MGLFFTPAHKSKSYPLFLRLILWTFLKLLCLIYPDSEVHSEHKATLRFILQYPRRVYTNLFPSAPTWWLLLMVIVLNGIDWAAFELLNIRNPATETIPTHYRVLDGLFQALAVRSGGFYVVNISTLVRTSLHSVLISPSQQCIPTRSKPSNVSTRESASKSST
jgi:Trk-type K+ transport system membrane component